MPMESGGGYIPIYMRIVIFEMCSSEFFLVCVRVCGVFWRLDLEFGLEACFFLI